MKQLIEYFIPAKYLGDDELLRRSRFAIWFLMFVFIILVPASIFIIYTLPDKMLNTIIGCFFTLTTVFVALIFRRTGHFWIVSVGFGFCMFAGMFISLFFTGGIYSPDLYNYLFLPLIALVVGNRRIGTIYVGLTFAAAILFYALDHWHYISSRPLTDSMDGGYFLFDFLIGAGIVYIVVFRNEKIRLSLVSELRTTNKVVSEKNKEITDSINYARLIQQGILPSHEVLSGHFSMHFILYRPKDIVSGDFYWCASSAINGSSVDYIAAVDCTGHGVPGAFMSMLGYSLLNQSVNELSSKDPAEILNYLNGKLPENLKSQGRENLLRDGMDISICAIDKKNSKLYYAGANNSIWIVRGKQLQILKADKQAISASNEIQKRLFTLQTFDLQKDDMIYLFTDGYSDQFGGPKGKKFKYKQLMEKLKQVSVEEMQKQENFLSITLDQWKGNLEQVDDVLIIGIRFPGVPVMG